MLSACLPIYLYVFTSALSVVRLPLHSAAQLSVCLSVKYLANLYFLPPSHYHYPSILLFLSLFYTHTTSLTHPLYLTRQTPSSSQCFTKIHDVFSFPARLHLDEFLAPDAPPESRAQPNTYLLHSVLVHSVRKRNCSDINCILQSNVFQLLIFGAESEVYRPKLIMNDFDISLSP